MENLLKGKTALITGAARGIGRGIAVEVARQGADIIIIDINETEAPGTIELVQNENRRVSFIPADISQVEEMESLAQKAWQVFGRIDILVNNAGIGAPQGLSNTSLEEWRKVLDTNLTGHTFLTKAVVARMIEQKIAGVVLFITSVHQDVTQTRPAYSVSKSGLKVLIRELGVELGPKGIRVVGIAPGYIKLDEGPPETNPFIPLGRSGTPAEIGRVAVSLVSDWGGSYITGQVLTVDGGFSAIHYHSLDQQGLLRKP